MPAVDISAIEFLVAINFSNLPFLGLVDTAAAGFVEVTPAVERPRPTALPSLALDACGFRIFRRSP
ncbi:MAG TPA: hypothetical protein VMQ86_01650 [Bryobacteraceae bacterium]|nr:hypothetical protein [Bryobacteraceae bacterium]